MTSCRLTHDVLVDTRRGGSVTLGTCGGLATRATFTGGLNKGIAGCRTLLGDAATALRRVSTNALFGRLCILGCASARGGCDSTSSLVKSVNA